MSHDSTTKNSQEVDLDDIDVEVMIIAKNPKALVASAAFLTRRGWPTTVFSNIAQAVEVAAEKKPDFVLISLNHQNPAMPKLIELMQTTFGATCVAFMENQDAASSQKLTKANYQYKVFGQMSGPNLHRSIRRILGEKLNFDADSEESSSSRGADNISIKGGSAADGGVMFQKGVHSTKSEESEEILSSGKYKMSKTNRHSLKDLAATGLRPIENPWANLPAAEEKSHTDATDAYLNQAPVSPELAIEKAVQTALERICQPGGISPEPVEHIESVGVFPVDSPNLPGYLVLAWPKQEMRAEEAFFKLAQETLKTAFQEMDVQAHLELGFFVEIPQVDFVKWVSEKATFKISLSHRERELGVAFFATKKPLPKAQPVDGNSMYSIGVDQISTERPVTFKAYLHFKKNKKYFLYLRNGRQLQPEQQKRLKESKVKDFYMKSVDIENLRSFLAASYLSETIKKKSGGGGENAA